MTLGLLLSLAVAAAPAKAHALEVMQEQCLLHAADPTNPWALAHGITANGASFLAADGRRAADVIVQDFVQRVDVPDAGAPSGGAWGFLKYAADGTPIEPHTNLLTRTLVFAGLPQGTTWKTKAGPVTLAQLQASARAGFRHVPQSEEYWKDVGWTLDLLGRALKPGKATFTPSDGQVVDFDQVMDDALAYHLKATAELQAGMEQGLPMVPKNKKGIYAHSCGGLHLTQAIFAWARHPQVKKRWGARLDTMISVLFYRLESERAQYDAALQAAPQYQLQVLTQMVKFYGHFLETTARLRKETGWKPTEGQAQAVRKAKALLDAAVRQLEAVDAFRTMDRIKIDHRQVWLDLIGDGCHAANGLKGWP